MARPALTGADLHLHSHHSDGEWSPAELVDAAARAGLAPVAPTDPVRATVRKLSRAGNSVGSIIRGS